MDNLNTSENDSGPEEGQYVRGHPQRRVGDLREVLNIKRQQSHEGKNNGPPPDPKHNFLSDPLRDNEQDSKNIPIPDNIDNARFSTTYNQPHFQTRVSRGGRGRFGSSNRGDRRSQYGSKRDEEWKDERIKIDQERSNKQRSDDGGWIREWDAGKEEISASTNRGRYNPQHRDQNYVHHRKYDNSSRSDKQQWPDSQRFEHHSRSDTYSKSDSNYRSTHQSRSGRPSRSDNQSRFDNQPRFAMNDSTLENHTFRSDNLKFDQEPDPDSRKYHRRTNPRFNRDQEDSNTPKSAYDQQDPNTNPGSDQGQQDPNTSRPPRKHFDRSNQNVDQQDPSTNLRSHRKYDRSNQNPGAQLDQEPDERSPKKYVNRSIQNADQYDASTTRSPRKYQDRSNQNPRSDLDQQPDHRSLKKYQDRSNQKPDQQDPNTNRSPRSYQDKSNQNPRSDLDQQSDHRSSRKYQDRSNQNPDQQDPNTNRSPRRYQDRSYQNPRSDLDQQPDHKSSRKYQDRSNQNPDQQDPNVSLRSPRTYQDRSNQDSNNTRAPRKYYSGKSNPKPDQVPNSTVGSPRQYNPDKSNRGSNQYRPPHRFNPNYRGSKSYSKRRNINPVNITVEYSVDTGERKCTYDIIKSEKDTGKVEENAESVSKQFKGEDNWASVPQDQEEENWDEYDYNEECETTPQLPKESGQNDLHDFEEDEPDLDEDFERIAEKVNSESNEVDLMSEMKKAEELTLHDYEDELEVETGNISEMKKDDLIQIGELKQCVSKLKEMLGNEPGIDSELDELKNVDAHVEDVQTSKHVKELQNSKQIEQQDLKQEIDLKKTTQVDKKKEEPKPKVKQLKSNNLKQDVKQITKLDEKKDLKPKEIKESKSIAKNSKQDVKKNGKQDSKDEIKSIDKLKKSEVDEVKNVHSDITDTNLEEIEMHLASNGKENKETKIVEDI